MIGGPLISLLWCARNLRSVYSAFSMGSVVCRSRILLRNSLPVWLIIKRLPRTSCFCAMQNLFKLAVNVTTTGSGKVAN
jgi:hypothetical protein